jgi:hypothetical protein
MSPIKGIEIQITKGQWSLNIGMNLYSNQPFLVHFTFGPVFVSLNKPQYFKNGVCSFEVFT